MRFQVWGTAAHTNALPRSDHLKENVRLELWKSRKMLRITVPDTRMIQIHTEQFLSSTQFRGPDRLVCRDYSYLFLLFTLCSLAVLFTTCRLCKMKYHPNPGVKHGGAQRSCYLPDTKEGNELLLRLQYAFRHG